MDTLSDAVAATLRAERAAAQMTQAELAKLAGVGYQTVVRLEKGTRSPSVEQLAKLCAVLDVSMSDLIERAEQRLAR